MSDTPRTDDKELHYRQVCEDKDMPSYLVPADFARQLERELAEARQKIEDLRSIANVNGDWTMKVCQLKRELADAKEYIEGVEGQLRKANEIGFGGNETTEEDGFGQAVNG